MKKRPAFMAAFTLMATLAGAGCQKHEAVAQVVAPTLANRLDIIRERDSLAQTLVKSGDTVNVYVFIALDAHGTVLQPEVKPDPPTPEIGKAAIQLVMDMHFRPAMQDGKPKPVLTKIPVRFARPLQ